MAEILKVSSAYALALKAIIRNKQSSPEELRVALSRLGEEIGRRTAERFLTQQSIITTPLDEETEEITIGNHVCAIVTTKDDLEIFGQAIANIVEPCVVGYMNFEGRRGMAALTSSVREIQLPQTSEAIDVLVAAKAVLATGCTAITLTRTAIREYKPVKLVIATIFLRNPRTSRTCFSLS